MNDAVHVVAARSVYPDGVAAISALQYSRIKRAGPVRVRVGHSDAILEVTVVDHEGVVHADHKLDGIGGVGVVGLPCGSYGNVDLHEGSGNRGARRRRTRTRRDVDVLIVTKRAESDYYHGGDSDRHPRRSLPPVGHPVSAPRNYAIISYLFYFVRLKHTNTRKINK